MRTLAIVLGLAFAVIAIVYWLVPARETRAASLRRETIFLQVIPGKG